MFCGAAPVYSVKQFEDYKHEDLIICKLRRTIQICNSLNNSSLLSFKNLLIEQNMYVKKRNRNILYPNRINQNRTLQVFVNSFDNSFIYLMLQKNIRTFLENKEEKWQDSCTILLNK